MDMMNQSANSASVNQNRDEKNRKIAEWLEPSITLPELGEEDVIGVFDKPSPHRCWIGTWEGPGVAKTTWIPADFYTSEEASALVLEKMSTSDTSRLSVIFYEDRWTVIIRIKVPTGIHTGAEVEHAERKTAIAEAALKLIETEGKKQ